MPGIETVMKVLGNEIDRLKDDLDITSKICNELQAENYNLKEVDKINANRFVKLDNLLFAWRERHYRLLTFIDEKNKTLKKKIEVPSEVREEPLNEFIYIRKCNHVYGIADERIHKGNIVTESEKQR